MRQHSFAGHCQYALETQRGNIHLEDVSNVLGEYRRAETLLNLVVPANPFVEAGALQQVHDGGKCLPENAHNCESSLKVHFENV